MANAYCAVSLLFQEPFLGQKSRRRSSVAKHFEGDYLQLGSNPAVIKILSRFGTHACARSLVVSFFIVVLLYAFTWLAVC